MTEKLLSVIKEQYTLTELNIGDMAKLKTNGMTFTVNAYNAEGLGHLSVMRAKGFFGLMKMDTVIINPTALDLPLYSYDRIYAMGNDTLIVELYDTLLNECDLGKLNEIKTGYTDLSERDPGEHWYDSIKLSQSISKKGKRRQQARFDDLATKHFQAYLWTDAQAVSNAEAKQKKAAFYVEGLLKNGGPSTDVFKKSLGEEKTAKLFREVLFGTCSV